MFLLTSWQTFWKPNRKEMAFHCDLLLEPGDFIVILSSNAPHSPFDGQGKIETIAPPPGEYTKVHLAASWEHRKTMFVEDDNREDD